LLPLLLLLLLLLPLCALTASCAAAAFADPNLGLQLLAAATWSFFFSLVSPQQLLVAPLPPLLLSRTLVPAQQGEVLRWHHLPAAARLSLLSLARGGRCASSAPELPASAPVAAW
jgi:hypothetical protein